MVQGVAEFFARAMSVAHGRHIVNTSEKEGMYTYHVAHELWMLLGVVPGLCHHWLSVLTRVVHPLQPVVWKMLAAAPVVHGGPHK